jgi:hypothetical protein
VTSRRWILDYSATLLLESEALEAWLVVVKVVGRYQLGTAFDFRRRSDLEIVLELRMELAAHLVQSYIQKGLWRRPGWEEHFRCMGWNWQWGQKVPSCLGKLQVV